MQMQRACRQEIFVLELLVIGELSSSRSGCPPHVVDRTKEYNLRKKIRWVFAGGKKRRVDLGRIGQGGWGVAFNMRRVVLFVSALLAAISLVLMCVIFRQFWHA